MHVTKEGIDRLKASNPLEVILADRGIELRKKGRVLVARCPFHEEKTASFTVTPAKGLYHCFGCGARGDVFGFITKRDKVGFPRAMEILARRAALDLKEIMAERPAMAAPSEAPHANGANGHGHEVPHIEMAGDSPTARRLLASVVEHYHRTFCERPDAQEYLKGRGLVDAELLKAWKVGYADGSLLKTLPKSGEVRDGLVALGVITAEGRELMGGCVVFPLADPISAAWINLYGRGVRSGRHCYLPGPLRGVFNFQAARAGEEVILTESVIDACSFHQAGVRNSIPLYGINGFTSDHLDLLKREGVKRVVLALDNDEPGRRATDSIKERLVATGLEARSVEWPEGVKDANEVLVSWSAELLREIASGHRPTEALEGGHGQDVAAVDSFPLIDSVSSVPAAMPIPTSRDGSILLSRHGLDFSARVQSTLLGRLRVTVKVSRGDSFHVDSIDLYASRARSEFAKKVEKVLSAEGAQVEAALLSLIVECERVGEADGDVVAAQPEPMSESDRREALAFLKRPDLLDEVGRDMDALGYVGETSTKILGYLISVSRKGDDPCSAIVISQSGAGKSALTEVIEKLTPPEDVVLFTRLTPQSLYYTEPGFLDHKLIMIEERNGSMEADYSIRVLQSRKKLIAAVPIKDPATGNMRTKIFTVEARAAFIEATTAGAVNHENATRCFELSMDESPAQTQRIHGRQRVMRTEAGLGLRKEAEAIASKHWNAQRILESLPVIIPFAEQLTFPSSWMRTRRDHARFLNLIEVSAFLHQYQRERRSGAIVASVADYAVAYSLAGEVLKDTLQDLKKPLRETFEHIRVLSSKSDGALTRSAIREALALPDSTVRRWLAELVELEYLETETVKQGKAARYALTGRIPQENLALGLLSPEDLAGKLSNFATSPNLAKAVWRT
ncbi:MAG: toprim domain-containing protein [Vicinamibacteria bacterium]|nr:toprim domain-containing protein [Vicinamibacteria bacterium]MBP9944828.1 toprim domain-containing protein [Vicinamibacteria bacterium]